MLRRVRSGRTPGEKEREERERQRERQTDLLNALGTESQGILILFRSKMSEISSRNERFPVRSGFKIESEIKSRESVFNFGNRGLHWLVLGMVIGYLEFGVFSLSNI